VVDMKKISKAHKTQLLDLYSEIQNTVFPSLVEQFSSSFETRQKIDELFLSILKIQVSLPKLHSLIKNELLNLKKINKI
ncbi:hypothetical protein OAJ04_04475, partial [Candidatus Nitrosopelagicus sp.]|nr:hypothetical protein [Candidatus Nitrosopelagicus sp.]